MDIKHSLKTRLSFSIAIVVLVAVALISFLANIFVNKQFNDYISKAQQQKMHSIALSVSGEYNVRSKSWNEEKIHDLGMQILYEGYIIKVYDNSGNVVWDAVSHDMDACSQVMKEISERMLNYYPNMKGDITSKTITLATDGVTTGKISLSYYGPYFLSENDYNFINRLNIMLILVGFGALIVSFVIGVFMAKHLSRPILNAANAAKQISDGQYKATINENTNINEINTLIDSINNLAHSLDNQKSLRKKLSEDISHELRTPISILQSHIEAMVEGVWQPTAERLKSCEEEVKRIGSLVNDIENIAKVEDGVTNLKKSSFDLYNVTQKVINSFEVVLIEKNITVDLKGKAVTLFADMEKISRCIINLLNNGIKYCNDNGKILIEIDEKEGYGVFKISDNGIGISQNELSFIFERFYRADKSRNRKTGGSGLGLSIVKSIIEAHGGSISVNSVQNEGTTFVFKIPKEVTD